MILTLTGVSAAGKTSIAGVLLRELPIDARMVPSYTIRKFRKPRPNDLPGEYKHVSRFRFWFLEKIGAFLWTAHLFRGNSYGTTERWVARALKDDNTVYIMILTPDAVIKLERFAKKSGYSYKVFPHYVISPPEEILRERLRSRGDKEEDIEKRLIDCIKWDSEARTSGIPYEFVENNGIVESAAKEVENRFLEKLGGCDCYF